jgi:hypothetical protein
MAEARRETRRGGFHTLEKKVHDLEEADRAEERRREAAPEAGAGELEVMSEIRPPPAHDE